LGALHFAHHPFHFAVTATGENMTTSVPVVRAIDLGYGYIKYTTRNRSGAVPEIVTRTIPALAIPVTSGTIDDNVGLRKPQTITVTVREQAFQVGPDSPLFLHGDSGRHLASDYSRSTHYEALMLGTLAYIDEPAIDLLVLGLPITRCTKEEKDRIAQLYTGTVQIPVPGEDDRTRKLNVKRCVVLPQPFGGYLDALAQSADGGQSWLGSTLVIDPGYFTFDWIVVSSAKTYVPTRSGALHGGMSAVHRAIADNMQRVSGIYTSSLHHIDTAMKSGDKLVIEGREFDLKSFEGVVTAKCNAQVADMVSRLGDRADIRRIVLCGGGAKVMHGAIAAAFPHMPIISLKDAMHANVRGFQKLGMAVAKDVVAA
jgi:plasmid segregation protein ParM